MKLLRSPRLGFYDLEKAERCPLSALASSLGLGLYAVRELPTRPILVGLFFHSLMEKDVSSLDGNDDFDFCLAEVNKLEANVQGNPRLRWMGSPSTWKEINAAANAFLSRGIQHQGKSSALRITTKLTSKSGLLVGKPDFLRIEGREANLWEFKSAHIYSEGMTIAKHVRQILYYSSLILQNFEVDRIKGRIMGLAGHESPRDISRSEAIHVGEKSEELVRKLVAQVEAANSLEEIAVPGIPNCLECSFRTDCPAFLRTQFSDENFNSFRVIRGTLHSAKGNGPDVLLDVDGTAVTIRAKLGIGKEEIASLLGQKIIITYCRTSSNQAELTFRSQVLNAAGEVHG